MAVTRVISGGQTGVDRAALDAALDLGIPVGGFCPKGRLAEDGVIPAHYPLAELATESYPARTSKNIEHSDGTLLLFLGIIGYGSRGSQLAVRLCRERSKPLCKMDLGRQPCAETVRRWIEIYSVSVLNVAGNRESGAPGIGAKAKAFLLEVLKP